MPFPRLSLFRSELEGQPDTQLLGEVVRKSFDDFDAVLQQFLENAGFNSDGSFNNLVTNNLTVNNNITQPSTSSGAVLYVASRRLTDAQIKNLPTTPVELRLPDGSTSAPGVGFICNLVRWAWTLDNRSGIYSGGGGTFIRLTTGSVRQAWWTNPFEQVLGNASIWSGVSEPSFGAEPHFFHPSDAENQPILVQFENASVLADGHASNYMTVHAYYVKTPVASATVASQINWTTTGQLVAPPAADGVSITPSGTSLAYSAWVEVTASTASDWLLTGASVVGSFICFFGLEVGVGSLGNEVTIAEILGNIDDNLTVIGNGYMIWPIPIASIGTGVRVSVRLRKNGTDTTAWRAALTYLPVPAAGNVDSTTENPAALVFSPAPTVPPAAWAGSSAWIPQLVAAESLLVWGIMFTTTDAVAGAEIDIGVGPNGSEQTIATIRTSIKDNSAVLGGGMHWLPCKPVIDGINAGDLVSVRTRSSAAGGGITWTPRLLTSGTTSPAYPLLTQQPSIALPAVSIGAGPATGGSAWTNGSWVEVTPMLLYDTAIQTLSFYANSAGSYEVDLGTGSVGSESVKGTVRFEVTAANSGNDNTLTLPYGLVLAGRKRFAIRLRGTATSQTVQIAFTATENPNFDQRTSVACATIPAAANSKTVAGKNSDWGNSNWVQLSSNVGVSDIFIYAILYTQGVNTVEFEIDLGTGPAASEVVLTTVRSYVAASAAGFNHLPIFPPVRVSAGTALSARVRKEGTSTASWGLAVNYFGDVLA